MGGPTTRLPLYLALLSKHRSLLVPGWLPAWLARSLSCSLAPSLLPPSLLLAGCLPLALSVWPAITPWMSDALLPSAVPSASIGFAWPESSPLGQAVQEGFWPAVVLACGCPPADE